MELAHSLMSELTISQIANLIIRDHKENGKEIYFGAVPYVSAMREMEKITDYFGADDGRSVVCYALSNLTKWRGPIAKEIKAELNRRLKSNK
jgi:hypothetical protein